MHNSLQYDIKDTSRVLKEYIAIDGLMFILALQKTHWLLGISLCIFWHHNSIITIYKKRNLNLAYHLLLMNSSEQYLVQFLKLIKRKKKRKKSKLSRQWKWCNKNHGQAKNTTGNPLLPQKLYKPLTNASAAYTSNHCTRINTRKN